MTGFVRARIFTLAIEVRFRFLMPALSFHTTDRSRISSYRAPHPRDVV